MSRRVSVRLNTGPTVALYVFDCPNCGVIFAITDDYDERRRSDTRSFYCPNGHTMSYAEGDSARLKREQAANVALRDQLDAAVRAAEGVRAALLRDRQRFANGVCPCCNRTFQNVLRHMRGEHPDYDVTTVKQPGTVRFRCSCTREFETLRGLRIHQGSQRPDDWAERSQKSDYWSKRSAHLTVVGAS